MLIGRCVPIPIGKVIGTCRASLGRTQCQDSDRDSIVASRFSVYRIIDTGRIRLESHQGETRRKWMIIYRMGNDLNLDAVIALYEDSTLGVRRPIDDRARMSVMIANANLVITAWDGDLLVGMARSLSDFSYVTYLSDLAVRLAYQRTGIGKELIRRTQAAGGDRTKVLLIAAPVADQYYPHIGFVPQPRAWALPPGEVVR